MKLIINNQTIVSHIMDNEKTATAEYINFFEIPEIPANRNLIKEIIRNQSDLSMFQVIEGNLFKDGQIQTVSPDVEVSELQTEYQNAIVQLNQIEDAINPTNAQVINAVKFLARTTRFILRLFIRKYLN